MNLSRHIKKTNFNTWFNIQQKDSTLYYHHFEIQRSYNDTCTDAVCSIKVMNDIPLPGAQLGGNLSVGTNRRGGPQLFSVYRD